MSLQVAKLIVWLYTFISRRLPSFPQAPNPRATWFALPRGQNLPTFPVSVSRYTDTCPYGNECCEQKCWSASSVNVMCGSVTRSRDTVTGNVGRYSPSRSANVADSPSRYPRETTIRSSPLPKVVAALLLGLTTISKLPSAAKRL